MKKLAFLLFLPSLSWGANVTQAQAQQAKDAAAQLMQTSQTLFAYANYINAQFDNGFTLQVAQSTSTFTMPTVMQNDLINIAKYNALKAALVAEFNLLP